MTIKCPYCGLTMTTETELVKGQHVRCPSCRLKFSYGEEAEASSYFEAKFWSLVSQCPWSEGLMRTHGIILKFMPHLLGLVALVAGITWLVTLGRQNAPVSVVFKPWLVLIVMAVSVQVSRKAMALPCRTMESCARLTLRPQMAYVLKVAGMLGMVIGGCSLAINVPERDFIIAGIALALLGLAWGICLEDTSLLRIRVGTPANCVEEAVALVLLPLRFLNVVLPIAVTATVIGGVIYAFAVFGGDGMLIATLLAALVMLPMVASLAAHLNYVFSSLCLELMKAEVTIPIKLDELRQALAEKGRPEAPVPPPSDLKKVLNSDAHENVVA